MDEMRNKIAETLQELSIRKNGLVDKILGPILSEKKIGADCVGRCEVRYYNQQHPIKEEWLVDGELIYTAELNYNDGKVSWSVTRPEDERESSDGA